MQPVKIPVGRACLSSLLLSHPHSPSLHWFLGVLVGAEWEVGQEGCRDWSALLSAMANTANHGVISCKRQLLSELLHAGHDYTQ